MGSSPQRLRRLQRRLETDVLLITHLANLFYLVGFRGSSGVLAVTRQHAVLFTDGRYRTSAGAEVRAARLRITRGDPLVGAAAWANARGFQTIGFEDQHLTVAQKNLLERTLGRRSELRAAARGVESLRALKEEKEIACLRAAAALTARVFEEILPLVRPGVRERDLAAEIEYRMKQHGASGPGFETIVASGPGSALPHGRASDKRLAKNELVIFDLGAILRGYHSDMTRTVFLGKPSARVKRLYGAVEEAQEHAREAVRAGVEARRVDGAARRVLAARGYGRYFSHGTGHGLGLEIHEEPRIAPGVKTPLAAGHVITIEPGVYIPGWGGVRLEDVVVVRARGGETLTPLPTELLCL